MSPEGSKLPNQTPSITTPLDLQIRNVLSLLKCNFWVRPFGQLWKSLGSPCKHTPSRTLGLTCCVCGWEEVWDGEQEGPCGSNGRQRQREKRLLSTGMCEPIWVYIHCFISGRLEFTGILTISLLNSTWSWGNEISEFLLIPRCWHGLTPALTFGSTFTPKLSKRSLLLASDWKIKTKQTFCR